MFSALSVDLLNRVLGPVKPVPPGIRRRSASGAVSPTRAAGVGGSLMKITLPQNPWAATSYPEGMSAKDWAYLLDVVQGQVNWTRRETVAGNATSFSQPQIHRKLDYRGWSNDDQEVLI